jgi:hypothetical protein
MLGRFRVSSPSIFWKLVSSISWSRSRLLSDHGQLSPNLVEEGLPAIREMARLLVTSAFIIPSPTPNLTVRRATWLRYTRRARQFGELHHPQCFLRQRLAATKICRFNLYGGKL